MQAPLAGLHAPPVWHVSAGPQTTAVPAQTPEVHVSFVVQASPSSQLAPSGFGVFRQAPVVGSQPPVWQASTGGHVTELVPVQTPAWHVSAEVQALPSLQVVPSGFAGLVQAPVVVSQTPAVWHWSEAVQITAVPGVQTPFWQVSFLVQASPSLQAVPFATAVLVHVPVLGSHDPTWHWSAGGHMTGFMAVQAPALQVAVIVQATVSVQAVPSAFAGCEQIPDVGLQTPAVWHSSSGVQVVAVPPVQTPLWQVSPEVHSLPSSQLVPEKSLHVPSTSAPASTEHASHTPPAQAVLQQTPLTQNPVPQSEAFVQGSPTGEAKPETT